MGWISVKDSLPTFDGDVLCFSGRTSDRVSVKLYQTHSGGFFLGNYGVEVTHWMELPEPPSSGADNIMRVISSIRGSTHYDTTFNVHLKLIDGELCQLTSNQMWITSDHKDGANAINTEEDIVELRSRYVQANV